MRLKQHGVTACRHSFIVLTLVTERGTQFESWMEDDRQLQRREVFTWTWLKYSSIAQWVRSGPGAQRVRSCPGAHRVRSGPGAQWVRSCPGAHRVRSGPGAQWVCSGPGAHSQTPCSAGPALASCSASVSGPSSVAWTWPAVPPRCPPPLCHPPGLLFCAPDCGASGIRSLEGGSVTVTGLCALDGHQRSLCLCWAHGLLCLCCAMCYLLSIVCPLPSCYQIIVSVAPPVSPSLPSFVSLFSLLVSVVLCWSFVFRPVCIMFDCVSVLCLPACFSPSGRFLFILLLKRPILHALESSPHLSHLIPWHPVSFKGMHIKIGKRNKTSCKSIKLNYI